MLVLALACGGGAGNVTSSPSTPLVYTDPTDTTSWRLTHDPASTPAHLILDLMAPSGASGQGVTLILTTDASKATWHAFSSGGYLQGLVFSSPLVDVASVQGSALRIVAAKEPGAPVTYGSAPVLQVGLDSVAGAAAGNVTLSATDGGHLGAAAPAVPIPVQVGSLVTQ
jgi:hypothetical protein